MKEKELFREFYNKVYPIWKPMTTKYNRLHDEAQCELEKWQNKVDHPEEKNALVSILSLLVFISLVGNVINLLTKGSFAYIWVTIILFVATGIYTLVIGHKAKKRLEIASSRYEKELNNLYSKILTKVKPIVEEYDLISLEDTMNGTYVTVIEMIESKRADTVKEALLLIDEENRRKEQSKNQADMMKKLKEIRENTRHPSTNYYDD